MQMKTFIMHAGTIPCLLVDERIRQGIVKCRFMSINLHYLKIERDEFCYDRGII